MVEIHFWFFLNKFISFLSLGLFKSYSLWKDLFVLWKQKDEPSDMLKFLKTKKEKWRIDHFSLNLESYLNFTGRLFFPFLLLHLNADNLCRLGVRYICNGHNKRDTHTSPNCRPAMFSVPCWCLHPFQVSRAFAARFKLCIFSFA